jgi:hypothetical protein
MSALIDPIHFKELAKQDSKEVCRRTGCRYDEPKQCYLLNVWGMEYAISPHQRKVACIDEAGSSLPDYFELFMIHYLMSSKKSRSIQRVDIGKRYPRRSDFFPRSP